MTARPVPYAGIATRALGLGADAAIANAVVLAGGAVIALVSSLVGELRLSTLERILAAGAWLASSAPTSCCSGAPWGRRPACGSWVCG
jgi:hypothetical protein